MNNQQEIITAIADALGIPTGDVDPQAHLFEDLGLNPVELADLLGNISAKFNIIFDSAETRGVNTVNDLIELIEDKLLE